MANAGKVVKGKEALHVVFLNFERGLSFRGLSFRGLSFRDPPINVHLYAELFVSSAYLR